MFRTVHRQSAARLFQGFVRQYRIAGIKILGQMTWEVRGFQGELGVIISGYTFSGVEVLDVKLTDGLLTITAAEADRAKNRSQERKLPGRGSPPERRRHRVPRGRNTSRQ